MSGVTRWELVAYALSALIALSALFVLPVVRAVDPVLAAGLSFEGGVAYHAAIRRRHPEQTGGETRFLDPWGRPWRWSQAHLYSVGPDGIDASGEDDDITTDELRAHPLRGALTTGARRSLRGLLVAAGLLLALWTFFTRDALRAPRRSWSAEAVHAALIVLAPAVVGGSLVLRASRSLEGSSSTALGVVQLPPSLAALLSWWLLCYLPALAWRLSRPRVETPPT